MNLFGMMEVSGSALKAERIRAEVVAANMANANTTRTADGSPYKRQQVVFSAAEVSGPNSGGLDSGTLFLPAPAIGGSFQSQLLSASGGMFSPDQSVPGGVEVSAVVADRSQAVRRYDPQHPDADKDGYVAYPDINPLTEMVDLLGATRAYGLNSSAVQAAKSMIASSLDILK
jgi:flagellar basal-body rod protein FlgC